ncbi:SMP-30/gluconolactonase/LRE family protein [Cupriavidus sp. H18C2]|uniref:SMP-30/gluconolactonase/LRE family protein n=1 Tax=Cupriavidus sp. H18C2 TaxID=3241602 RepID=UPI003BF92153
MIVRHSTRLVEVRERRTADGLRLREFRVGNRVGECPVWDAGQLAWIDVRAPAFHVLDPRTRLMTTWHLDKPVGAHCRRVDGRIVLALSDELAVLDPVTGKLRTVAHPEPDRPGNRLNEGRVSPCGNWFLFGSMDDTGARQPTGRIHALHASGRCHVVHDGLYTANGFAWAADAQTFYFSDSLAGVVYRARWQADTGTLDAIAPWIRAGEQEGRPDGAFVDDAGNYWSAGVSAGRLNVYAPGDGAWRFTVALPCQAPSMPCPGPDGSVFVTSLVRPQWQPDDIRPEDGQLFQLMDVLDTGARPSPRLSIL